MAFAITHKLSNGSATDASTYTTASVSVTAGDMLWVVVTNASTVGTADALSGVVGTLGTTLTWSTAGSVLMNSSLRGRTTIAWAVCPSTTSGTLTFQFGGVTQASGQWTVLTTTGSDTGTPVANVQTLQSTAANPSITLSPSPAATSAVIAAMHVNGATGGTAGTGYALIGSGTAQATPSITQSTEQDITTPSATVAFVNSGTLNRGTIAVEIQAPLVPTGTLAATLADTTLVAAGAETFTGTLAATLDDTTMAATAAETFSGPLAATLDDATLVASGSSVLAFTGTLAATLDDVTMAASGTEAFTGTLAATLADVTLVAPGTQTFTGTMSATLEDTTLVASAAETIAGTLASTLGDTTLVASGTETVSGPLAATLDSTAMAATGALVIDGALTATLDGATLAAVAAETFTGILAATLGDATMAASGDAGPSGATGTFSATLADVAFDAVAAQTFSGSLAATLEDTTLAAAADQTITGILAEQLDDATLVAAGQTSPTRDVTILSVTERTRVVVIAELDRGGITERTRTVSIAERSDT